MPNNNHRVGVIRGRKISHHSFRHNTILRSFQETINDESSSSHINEEMASFEADVARILKETRAGKDTSLYPPGFVASKSRMSISHVWDLDMWKRHTSRTRYLRHTWFFNSRLFKRVLPQLTVVTLWSAIYAKIVSKHVAKGKNFVPLTSLSLVSTFVGFLLTLRSNQSLNRLAEGRELWGRTFVVVRDTAHLLAAYVYPKDRRLGIKAARHLAIFPWLLKGRLRDTDDSDVIDIMLPDETDRAFVTSQRKGAVANIARIRQVVANLSSRGNLLPTAAHQQIEANLNEMNYIVGMCERLRGSPVPPVYTSHTSRLLVFYLCFLPVALHGAKLDALVNVLVSTMAGYAMLGLDEISHLLELPFQLMPIHELSKNMMLDVADSFVCQPPYLNPNLEKSSDNFSYPFDDTNPAPTYW